jgi:hypothetical protein
MGSNVELSPRFNEKSAPSFFGEKHFERRALKLDKFHGRIGFDAGVIETGRFNHPRRRQPFPAGGDYAHSHPRIEAGRGVLPRVGTERDPQRTEIAHPDRDPKVIDVTCDLVDLGCERDRFACHVNNSAVLGWKLGASAAGTMSMWHAKEIKLAQCFSPELSKAPLPSSR